MSQYTINDRISTKDGYLATIKFVGHIAPWGDQILAYGLEWDDATRGKNNGSVNGISYFKPTISNLASFVKSTNKSITWSRQSFVDVVQSQYLNTEYHDQEIKFGLKILKETGLEELNRRYKNLESIKSLSLDHCLIWKAWSNKKDELIEGGVTDKVFTGLKSLQRLDLSSNLFSDFEQVTRIIARLPALEELILNGNRFTLLLLQLSCPKIMLSDTLVRLKLASTLLPVDKVNQLTTKFQELKELILSANDYDNECIAKLSFVQNPQLHHLDLSYNKLQRIPKLGILKEVNLSHNEICILQEQTLDMSNRVEALDLRHNCISSWKEIDTLASVAKNLKRLRINHNPLFDDITIDDMTVQLIARFQCGPSNLNELNGSKLSLSEIENAELYFISKVQSGEYQMPNEDRWTQLLRKYNKHAIREEQPTFKPWLKLSLLVFDSGNHTEPKHYRFLKSATILSFKGSISKLLLNNMSILKFKVFYYTNEDSEFAVKHEINNYMATLNDFALSEGQKVYISVR